MLQGVNLFQASTVDILKQYVKIGLNGMIIFTHERDSNNIRKNMKKENQKDEETVEVGQYISIGTARLVNEGTLKCSDGSIKIKATVFRGGVWKVERKNND